jgi:hypothetical protein
MVKHADDIARHFKECRGGCFLAGTLVETRTGRRPIESIRVGDEVLSRDEQTDEICYREVLRTFEGRTARVVRIELRALDGSGCQTLACTPEHPFRALGQGWIAAEGLLDGDRLHGADGTALEVSRVELVRQDAEHFNLEVEGTHTYLVSGRPDAVAAWVHNAGCGGVTPPSRQLTGSAPGTVLRNRLEAHEFEQAQRIVAAHGGTFVGAPRKWLPGIDGTFNGVPAALKRTVSSAPAAVLRHASVAESASERAGHIGVHLFVEAQNLPSSVLLDFARGGERALLAIPTQGVISRIDVLTKDGWVTFPGRRVGWSIR